jgi:multiple sugar transport system substrate-binding protein
VVNRPAHQLSRRTVVRAAVGVPTAVGAVAVAACGAPDSKEAAAPSASALAQEVTWTSWATDELGMNRVREQADLYMKQFPSAKVTIANVASSAYQDKLIAGLAGGSGPDVFRDNPADALGLIRQSALAELGPLLTKTRNTWWGSKDVKPTVMDWGKAKGKQYGLPMGTGAYYDFSVNRTLYRNAGLGDPPTKYDDPTWTFDKLLDVSKKLTKRTGSAPEQLGVDFSMSWNFLHPLVMSWGGDFMNYKTGEFRWTEAPATDAIQWMADLQLKQQVAPSAAENSSGAYKLEAGRLGFTWSTFNLAMYLLTTVKDQFEWDMVPPPHRPGQPAKIWFYTSWWVFNKASKVSDAAWNFLHWVGGPEGQRVEVEYTWTAPHFLTLDNKFGLRLGTGVKRNLSVATDFMKYISPDRPEINPRYTEAIKVLNPALAKVGTGEATAKQAMSEIKTQMDTLLKQGVEEDK